MKRIEVKLALPVVAPLLDVIKEMSDGLRTTLAVPFAMKELDPDFQASWVDELIGHQTSDVQRLLALFDEDFFSEGVIAFDDENAEVIVRACAAVRLQLRERYLKSLPDDTLEGGEVELTSLPESLRRVFMCYLFLATLQELIIQHLQESMLGA
ncbi:MAG: hypothetical protein Q8N18_02095 [Opitutaceae bacterium]|nr:hypothetical protein [Opitutaceae bacterium]